MPEKNKDWWSFTETWNASLLEREERETKPRDNLWASELGKANVDLYLRLKGVKATNPPNARALRKFEAGNIWEWITKLILVRAGILIADQVWVKYQYEGLLSVTGRTDFIAGGKPDYEKGKKELEGLMLPEVFLRAGRNIIKHFEEHYPNGLTERIIEIKSCSAFMFEVYLRNNKPSDNHRKQNFHYLKAKDMKYGSIVYVCRDDCRMLEFPVLNPSTVEDEYKADIEVITKFYKADEQPPLENLIVCESGRFTKNWKVGYSDYLTKLYGFEHPQAFEDEVAPKTARWNRVIGRTVKGDKMTDNNLDAIQEMGAEGFNFKDAVEEARKVAPKITEEDKPINNKTDKKTIKI